MTDRITAAAIALCGIAADECGVRESDLWREHHRMFKSDAKAALAAADAIQPIVIDKRIKRLEALVRSYRDKERTGR